MSFVQTGSFRFLESFEQDLREEGGNVDHAKQMVQRVLKHFPELHDETITVAATYPECSWHDEPLGMADPYNRLIYMNVEKGGMTQYQTLFHELTHVLIHVENQNGADHPATSEEYCSILAVSKMPSDMVYRDDIAYLGTPTVANEKYPEICQRALDYREDHRIYIQKCKEWLEINE